jgi:rubredoxin
VFSTHDTKREVKSEEFVRDYLRLIVQYIHLTRLPMIVRRPRTNKQLDVINAVQRWTHLKMGWCCRSCDLLENDRTNMFEYLCIDYIKHFFQFIQKENLERIKQQWVLCRVLSIAVRCTSLIDDVFGQNFTRPLMTVSASNGSLSINWTIQ